ncbi:MAG: GntR family transcriptional regulator [Planctomycetota bacterium]
MLSFYVEIKSGLPAYEQVVYAVKKAIIGGVLTPGDQFPSVRKLSHELRINPNTAHKVVAALVAEGLLEVKPGIGTIVSAAPEATSKQRDQILGSDVERLVVEARKLGLGADEVVDAVRSHWKRLR